MSVKSLDSNIDSVKSFFSDVPALSPTTEKTLEVLSSFLSESFRATVTVPKAVHTISQSLEQLEQAKDSQKRYKIFNYLKTAGLAALTGYAALGIASPLITAPWLLPFFGHGVTPADSLVSFLALSILFRISSTRWDNFQKELSKEEAYRTNLEHIIERDINTLAEASTDAQDYIHAAYQCIQGLRLHKNELTKQPQNELLQNQLSDCKTAIKELKKVIFEIKKRMSDQKNQKQVS